MENNKLKICFFGEAKPEDIHTVKWAKYFSDKGYDVHLFSYSNFNGNEVEKIKLHIIKKKLSITLWPFNTIINMPFTVKAVKKSIKEIKPDIVHAHCVTSYGTLASLTNFHPFVLTAWGSDILVNPNKNLVTKWATKNALKKADLITCDAEHMKDAIVRLNATPAKIKIINFGVDTQKFIFGEKDSLITEKFNLKTDPVIISLRGLEPIYDVESLIKSAKIILKENPNVRFLIIGKGSEKEKLENLAKELKIDKSINFIGWVLPEELKGYLNTADIYVSTSLSDGGIASSTAEAMSCGLPVVITDTGDNSKWVRNNIEGFIIPIKNPELLAKKIIYLLNNKDERRKFGQNARKMIEENNSYCGEMNKIEKIYQELSAKNHG